ncbi:PepSY domain-containing protein [Aurantivibrio infirmus]
MRRASFKFFRYCVWLHRYLGIAVGLIMVIWCLSGFVMMYMPYPGIDKKHELQSLPIINLKNCCDSTSLSSLKLVDINRFTIEMMSGDPVMRIFASGFKNPVINLTSGEIVENISQQQADTIAASYIQQMNIDGDVEHKRRVEQDQWTVTRFYQRHRPFYFYAANDPEKTQWYISPITGKVIQATTGQQRFWNYLGAIPHWLYPTVLRQHDEVWTQVVIYLSILGIFLTVLGLYLGIRQIRFRKSPKSLSPSSVSPPSISPYRGLMYWHHISGLTIGILILTWVTSGLFSMNPWNMIDFSGGNTERNNVQGIPLATSDLERFLDALATVELPEGVVKIEAYTLLGKLYLLMIDKQGFYQRYSGTTISNNHFALSNIGSNELESLSRIASAGREISSAKLLEQEDAYYYSLHGVKELPVYRIILNDEEQTRLYLNAKTGELASHLDKQKRVYRWIFSALHQGDFSGLIRVRPIWDIMMWLGLIGVTFGTVTGTYLGFRRLFSR